MAKAKSKATIRVSAGAGGMVQVEDRRFEAGDWPIRFVVPKDQADTWLRYLSTECSRRGWSCRAISQLEARENSGSITVNRGKAGKAQLAVVWERKRDGPMKVRAQSVGEPEFPLAELHGLFEEVNELCRSSATEYFYHRGQLHYDGLAWRGELWLDDTLRLGPPTQQYERALCGPRVVLVDALVEGIDRLDSNFVFDRELRELSIFLSVVMGKAVRPPEQGQTWTYTPGTTDCEVRSFGYLEPENPQQMPAPGACPSMPLRPVERPDFSERGIDGSTHEQTLPADVTDLWVAYRALTPDQRRDFLQATAKWQEALFHWQERSTLSYALMVIACEALKPSSPQFRNHNIYQIVEALLDKASTERLKEQERWFRSQDVRNAHLHRGEFRGSEFLQVTMMSSYQDPTFDQAHRELALITQAAIIEWLRRSGVFTMPVLERKKNLRHWVKKHALILVPALMIAGLVVGTVLGLILA